MRASHSRPEVFTIGHSTRSLEEFVAMLRAHGIQRIVDVRSIPRRTIIRSSTARSSADACAIGASTTATCIHSADCAMRARTPPTLAGITSRFAGLPTTCSLPSSIRRSLRSSYWPVRNPRPSYAPRPCPGAVIARSLRMRSLCAVFRSPRS